MQKRGWGRVQSADILAALRLLLRGLDTQRRLFVQVGHTRLRLRLAEGPGKNAVDVETRELGGSGLESSLAAVL